MMNIASAKIMMTLVTDTAMSSFMYDMVGGVGGIGVCPVTVPKLGCEVVCSDAVVIILLGSLLVIITRSVDVNASERVGWVCVISVPPSDVCRLVKASLVWYVDVNMHSL